jgi:methionyl-tRNA synthetase
VSQLEEEDYFLALEPHREWLRETIQSDRMRIRPVERRNEVLGMLTQPLPPLCVTRPKERVTWGIQVPFSPAHVTYVWFDALVNYISALGWPNSPRMARYWNEAGAVHLIGKDIIRHHALYWPIMLRALELRPPAMVFAHGWWKIGEQKMSKSLGNIVDPTVVIRQVLKDQPFAADIYRYFLLREVPFGHDGAFSEEALMKRLRDDLANDLGNLLHRTHSMIERYLGGALPAAKPVEALAADQRALGEAACRLTTAVDEAMVGLDYSVALSAIMEVVAQANRAIESAAPWQLAKTDPQRVPEVLAVLAEVIRIVAITLEPFLPQVAQAIWEQLGLGSTPRRLADATRWPGLPSGQPLGARHVLFPKNN